jgi:hypothetical protein
MITTLWAELSNRNIVIPLIQRDYAQGRTDENTRYIRRNIIAAIRKALETHKPLSFDFIYGHEETEPEAKMIPIDGQQRLTTLFLVHWYLAVRDDTISENRSILERFTYRTRVSSTDFCEKLIEEPISLPPINSEAMRLSAIIQDQPWFVASWMRDPTVAGMLVMLDEVHQQLNGISATFTDLVEKKLLTFHITDTKSLDLDENTYIRMNARGKLLTAYEHFKAQFEKFLVDNAYPNFNEFAKKMDIQWSRVLWQYRDSQHLIDSAFMALFSYFSEINFYLDDTLSKDQTFTDFVDEQGRDYWKGIYAQDSAIERLITYFDVIVGWRKPAEIFGSISNPSVYPHSGGSLFGEDPDLVRRCVDGKQFDIAEKVALYLVFEAHRNNPSNVDVVDLSERVRVVLNMLGRISQDDKYRFGFRSDLRYSDMPKYLQSASILSGAEGSIYETLTDDIGLPGFQKALAHEKEKAGLVLSGGIDKELLFRMEDDSRLQGSVWTLIREIAPQEIPAYFDAFRSLMDLDDQVLVLRALLTQQDAGEYLFCGEDYGWSAIGMRWYYGHSDRWLGILAHPQKQDSDLHRALRRLLEKVIAGCRNGKQTEEILNEIVGVWLAENHDFNDWRYYFVRYHSILDSSTNLFAWRDDNDNDFEVRTMSSFHARGRHINTYGRSLEKLIGDEDIVWHHESRTSGNEQGPVVLKYNTQLYCEKDGWRIVDPSKKARAITDPKVEPFPGRRGQFLLRHTEKEDRIEIAVRFIHKLFSEHFCSE